MVVLATPEPCYAVGSYYADFSQTADEEVIELLRRWGRFGSPLRDGGEVAQDQSRPKDC